MDDEGLREFIKMLGNFSDITLDTAYTKQCREFEGGDPIRFLRDLQDKCVRYGASSDFIVSAISVALSGHPEESTEERFRQIEANERAADE
jgi:hypothetical protein